MPTLQLLVQPRIKNRIRNSGLKSKHLQVHSIGFPATGGKLNSETTLAPQTLVKFNDSIMSKATNVVCVSTTRTPVVATVDNPEIDILGNAKSIVD
jgi:hypothetical protein